MGATCGGGFPQFVARFESLCGSHRRWGPCAPERWNRAPFRSAVRSFGPLDGLRIAGLFFHSPPAGASARTEVFMLRKWIALSLMAWLAVATTDGIAAAAPSAGARLNSLVNRYFEEQLKLSPIGATYIGDHRYDDKYTNSISPKFVKEQARRERRYLKELEAIDPATLERRRPDHLRRLQIRSRDDDRRNPLSGRAAADRPDQQSGDPVRRLCVRHQCAAVQDRQGLRQVSQAHGRIPRVPRPVDHQHAGRHDERRGAAARADGKSAAAAERAREGQGRGQRLLRTDQGDVRRISPPPIARG